MNAQQLRSSILQYAMEGKLVKQLSDNNFPESILNLKKNKIDKNSLPFEIPNSWLWIPLKNLGVVQTGNTPSTLQAEYYNDHYIPFIKPADFYPDGSLNYSNLYLSKEGAAKGRIVEPKSVMMVCIGGSRGKCSKVDQQVTFNQQINSITPNSKICDFEYLYYVFTSDYFQKLMKYKSTGTATPIVNKSTWSNFLIPLPTLEEQQSIVRKIKVLETQIDTYDKLHVNIESLQEQFPSDLEKSILKYAMQGKLVQQDARDEPASILVEKIQKEKEELVKKKIFKREKKLTSVIEEEIPFEIPRNWKWVKLKDLGFIISGGTPKTGIQDFWDDDGLLWITPSDMGKLKEKIIKTSRRKISAEGLKSSSAQLIPGKSIIYSSRAPIGHINIVEESYATNQGCKSLHPIGNYTDIHYVYYALKFMTPWIQKKASGTTFKEISGTVFAESKVPLPPLEEQKKIVSKIEELLQVVKMLNLKNYER